MDTRVRFARAMAPRGSAAVLPSRIAQPVDTPVVIAHRGASGHRPEHTLAAYRQAIRMGADYIEPDLVPTSDGVLVARHENEISGTTDVAEHPGLAGRRTTKVVDGETVTGWFTEDLTLAEIRSLRARERVPGIRPGNARYDGAFRIPTFDDVLTLVGEESRRRGRRIGVYPETKHPSYFDALGLSLEEPLVAALQRHGLDDRGSRVLVQSFETGNLRELAAMTEVRLVQLVDRAGAPYDLAAAGDPRTYDDLVTPGGLAEVATYADAVGSHKDRVLPRDRAGAVGQPSSLVTDAHEAGLHVHVWTLRDENRFLPTNLRVGSDPNARGDATAEARALLDAGVDGLFGDHPRTLVAAVAAWTEEQQRPA